MTDHSRAHPLAWPLRLPALTLVALTVLLPVAMTWTVADPAALPDSQDIDGPLRVSTVFAAISCALQIGTGMLLGLALARHFPAAARGEAPRAAALALLPWLLPGAVAALAWAFLCTRLPGVRGAIAWQDEPAVAWALWLLVEVWRHAPLIALFVCAAVQRTDHRLLESAALDGATPRAQLLHVTIPALAPALLLSLLFVLPAALGSFEIPYVLTRGGPTGNLASAAVHAHALLTQGQRAASAALISQLLLLSVGAGLALLGALRMLARRRS